LILDDREQDTFDFTIGILKAKQYKKKVKYLKNGQFLINLSISQVHSVKFMKNVPNSIVMSINGKDFTTNQLDTTDLP